MLGLLAIPLFLGAGASAVDGASEESRVLTPITVTARRVANLQPAGSYASMATELRFDPQINLQARGLPEGRSDITVRGGLFENTGFRLGAVTVTDPQTGHYAVEIPFDPAMLESPEVLTDFDNGLNSFNASVATVSYGFAPVSQGGRLTAGAGTDGLLYGTVRAARSREYEESGILGAMISGSASQGDGTLPYGDHDFKRLSGQLQWLNDDRETNLLLGYHDKFTGWPGMYTGFASLPETDQTKLGLAVLDHRWTSDAGRWQIGSAYRWLENDYDFDRRTQESGVPGSFEHETRNFSIALSGLQTWAGLDWHVNGQFTADRLVRSTDLTYGDFNSRSYGSLGIAPEREWLLASGAAVSLRAGLRADWSNRDENALSPLLGFSFSQQAGTGINRYDIEYSRATQLPGYTALNSRPTGLFGGNPDLGREYADTLRFGFSRQAADWEITASLFRRHDDDLVDWTFRSGAPSVRQANPVDIDVTGLEAYVRWQSAMLEIVGGYAWLDKDADYGNAEVDASYYALNFAQHRVTLAAAWQPFAGLEFRMDNEYRVHPENALRSSRDSAYLASLSANWQPRSLPRLGFSAIVDNLTDSDFQEFPGTPPMGRTASIAASLGW